MLLAVSLQLTVKSACNFCVKMVSTPNCFAVNDKIVKCAKTVPHKPVGLSLVLNDYVLLMNGLQ